MNFGEALDALKQGKQVYREGWNDRDVSLFLVPGTRNHVNHPEDSEIRIRIAQRMTVPWMCSQTDLLAEDWQIDAADLNIPYTERQI